MYKWAVKIYLKSGAVIDGCIESEYANSSDVAKSIFEREITTKVAYFGMSTNDFKGHLLFNILDVSAIELRAHEQNNND